MPPVTSAQPTTGRSAKSVFVKRVGGFANRVAQLPGRRVYVAVSLAAILFATAAGAFGTGDMPIMNRLAFWTLLIGLNTLAWACWFAWRVRGPKDWWPAAGLGAIVLNLPLPLEIRLLAELAGGEIPPVWPVIWLYAAILSAALLIVIIVALPRRSAPAEFVKGALWRAGARSPADVQAISAEDHYCRVYLGDGSNTLIHARFSALVAELGDSDGLVVRRGQWVAAQAVRRIERQDRRWIVELDGRAIPVAAGSVASLRDRGWI